MQKLHLGCGPIALPGWVNIDLDSPAADMAHDLTLGLPFQDGTVSHIFAEHVIEHFDHDDARALIAECRRVLAPGGVVRMSTPDLAWLAVVYRSGLTNQWGDLWRPDSPCAMLNEAMRAWGHKYLYDRFEFYELFRQAGFDSIIDCKWHESSDLALQNLESRPFHRELVFEARFSDGLAELPAPAAAVASPPDFGGGEDLLADQAREIDSLRVANHEFDLTIATLRQELGASRQLAAALQAHQDDLSAHIAGLESGLHDRDRHISGLLDGMRDRATHIGNVEARLMELDAEIAAAKQCREALEGVLQDRTARLEWSEQQMDERARRVSELEAAVTGLEQGLADRDWRLSDLEKRSVDRGERIAELEVGIADRDRHIVGLEMAMADRMRHIQGLEAGMTDRKRHIEGLEAGMADRQRHIQGLEAGMADRQRHIEGLEAGLADGEGRLMQAAALVDRCETQLAEREASISLLEQQLDKANLRMGGLVAALQRTIIGRLALRAVRRIAELDN